MLEERFRETTARHAMLPAGAFVLCACSGGADSTALLHLLCRTEGVCVVCAHFNHRLRGAESDRDEAFVRALCDSLGVECVTESADVADYAAARKIGLEEAARTLRYEFLERAAAEYGCARIATAHHAEDNAETVLWNLIRGSGARGLSGIPPVNGRLIRPLLNATRAEIEDYLAEQGLSFINDSSNDADDNPRNRIRHHILPLLAGENSGAVQHICAAAETLREDDVCLTAEAERFVSEYWKDGTLPIPALLALPEPVGVRVLRSLCGPMQRVHFKAVFSLCRSASAEACTDLPGLRVRKEYDRLCFGEPPEPLRFQRDLPVGETVLPELGIRVLHEPERQFDEIHNSFNTFFFKSDSIRGMISVACGNRGDRIRLFGRGCTKTLKKLFQEAKMPLWQRARTPVLYDEDGVIAVFGFGIAERCAAAAGDSVRRVSVIVTDADTDM